MTETAEGLVISEPGLKRQVFAAGSGFSVFVLVRAVGGPGDLIDSVTEAIAASNGVRGPGSADSRTTGRYVFQTSNGVMFKVQGPGSFADLRTWLDSLRAALAKEGWRGTILGPSNSPAPSNARRFSGGHIPWKANLWLTPTRPYTHTKPPIWGVPIEATREVTDFATAWVDEVQGTNYVFAGQGNYKVGVHRVPADLLAAGLDEGGQAYVSNLALKPLTERLVYMHYGKAEFSVRSVEEHWRDSIGAVRRCLVSLGHLVDYGCVAFAMDCRDGLEGEELSMGSRRGLKPGEWQMNRHMWASHVPEVYGMQILTKTHLERASDLREWAISSVGNGRYLVEAKDLGPWYSQGKPYARGFARFDFADLILTEAAIRADPRGWVDNDGYKPTIYL